MKIIAETGNPDLAVVYIADFGEDKVLEFVEALQPPYSIDERWILMVSTLFGCPVNCLICDAGGGYHGKPTKDQILMQIDYMVDKRFPGRKIPCRKFKIQFARMGEPSLNPAVLDVLRVLPIRYHAPGLIPSISTIAPKGSEEFMDYLLEIKNEYYSGGNFQFQYSIHSTDEEERNRLIPVRKWNFSQLADFGDKFINAQDRKITLNFALKSQFSIDVDILERYFDPSKYLIKITPINPTHQAVKNNIKSYVNQKNEYEMKLIIDKLTTAGYDVILSIGELEENLIGSNCGQYVIKHMNAMESGIGSYTYPIKVNEEYSS